CTYTKNVITVSLLVLISGTVAEDLPLMTNYPNIFASNIDPAIRFECLYIAGWFTDCIEYLDISIPNSFRYSYISGEGFFFADSRSQRHRNMFPLIFYYYILIYTIQLMEGKGPR